MKSLYCRMIGKEETHTPDNSTFSETIEQPRIMPLVRKTNVVVEKKKEEQKPNRRTKDQKEEKDEKEKEKETVKKEAKETKEKKEAKSDNKND